MISEKESDQVIMEFKDKHTFRAWLEKNFDQHPGTDIFIYKKGFHHLGLNYEDAVRTALCFGWIDAVTHRYNEQKFRQYFAPRRKGSTWSLSNILRMKELIKSGEMTENGMRYFNSELLDQIDELIEEERKYKEHPPEIPDYFQEILTAEDATLLFSAETPSAQNRYIRYILDAKQQETRIRRCLKVVRLLKGEKNNL